MAEYERLQAAYREADGSQSAFAALMEFKITNGLVEELSADESAEILNDEPGKS